MPLLCQRACAVVELPDGIELVLVRSGHGRLRRQIRARLPRLVWAVVAVVRAGEPAGCRDHSDDDYARVGAHGLLGCDALEGGVPWQGSGLPQTVVGPDNLRLRGLDLEVLPHYADGLVILLLSLELVIAEEGNYEALNVSHFLLWDALCLVGLPFCTALLESQQVLTLGLRGRDNLGAGHHVPSPQCCCEWLIIAWRQDDGIASGRLLRMIH
mmetsp:Transcript_63583/g.185935  ORF Transcript_63583/g.185935 Transcript_63583/m.185935 type:complete len:213 (-) Transcript_63583:108-746(-)